MASLSWPWEPLPEDEYVDLRLEVAYDPYAEQDKTPTERMYDEMNRDIEPQMERWGPER